MSCRVCFLTIFVVWKLATQTGVATSNNILLIKYGVGKFTIGQISSVKTDTDGVVRKVTVKNKLNQPKNTGVNYSESPYKYAERNVRGLALLITAQEKRDTEGVDTDILRTSPWLYNKDHTEEYNDEENVIDDESHEENVNENQESNFIENNVESEEDITELEAEENTAENVNRN